jgi:hypothetical protein
MLGFLTTESKTPIVHVKTLFSDSWATICKMPASAVAGLSLQDRADVRVKAAQRLNMDFLLEWSPYFKSDAEDRSTCPAWRTSTAINKPLADAPPWVAVWNRIVRKMVCSPHERSLQDFLANADALPALPVFPFACNQHPEGVFDRSSCRTEPMESTNLP